MVECKDQTKSSAQLSLAIIAVANLLLIDRGRSEAKEATTMLDGNRDEVAVGLSVRLRKELCGEEGLTVRKAQCGVGVDREGAMTAG